MKQIAIKMMDWVWVDFCFIASDFPYLAYELKKEEKMGSIIFLTAAIVETALAAFCIITKSKIVEIHHKNIPWLPIFILASGMKALWIIFPAPSVFRWRELI